MSMIRGGWRSSRVGFAVILMLAVGHPGLEAQTRPAPQAPAKDAARSLVSLSAGAIIVKSPKEFDEQWSAIWILDERAATGWASPEGDLGPHVFVIELPERSVLNEVVFDTGATDGAGRGAKDIVVEVSDVSPSAGFRTIATVFLKEKTDEQRFRASAQQPGRWLRLTVKNNHGDPRWVELLDFRAFGTQLTQTRLPDISGTYTTTYNDLHIRQEGTSVTGCYEFRDGLFSGGIDGRAITFTWREQGDQPNAGPATLVFTSDGQQVAGVWWSDTTDRRGLWSGVRRSREVGSCTHWSGGAQQQITKDLEEFGRARVYGINFDLDSDRIREESRPTLERIVAVMKQKPEWRVTLEGHTDLLGTAEHNQRLSEQRALAVKKYLQAAGIREDRLTAVGFGAARPVAPNDALGRAQNRRVEIVKH